MGLPCGLSVAELGSEELGVLDSVLGVVSDAGCGAWLGWVWLVVVESLV